MRCSYLSRGSAIILSLILAQSGTAASVNSTGPIQSNFTVDSTDPSVKYEPRFNFSPDGTEPTFCRLGPNGTALSGQAAECVNVASTCGSNATISFSTSAEVSFHFNGSAIYIMGYLSSVSPVYSVFLDDVRYDTFDGARPSSSFVCEPLFSATNLRADREHYITLMAKGPSPNRNMTLDPRGDKAVFGVANFIYTIENNLVASGSAAVPSTSRTLLDTALPLVGAVLLGVVSV